MTNLIKFRNHFLMDAPGFRIRLANDRASRERAYGLAYDVYLENSYVRRQAERRLVYEYDARPETVTFLAEDGLGGAIGTVSLIFDGPEQLPCDRVFHPEVAAYRGRDRRLVEVARLAISRAHRRSHRLLREMINLLFIYAVRIGERTHALIEVHPRHVRYYTRQLGFGLLAAPRYCPRVRGAPAALLDVDWRAYDHEVRKREGSANRLRASSLYSKFIPIESERQVSEFLSGQHRPMTRREARYFGLLPAVERLLPQSVE